MAGMNLVGAGGVGIHVYQVDQRRMGGMAVIAFEEIVDQDFPVTVHLVRHSTRVFKFAEPGHVVAHLLLHALGLGAQGFRIGI